MEERVLGWHFLAENRRLRYGGRQEIRAGMTCHVEPPLELCRKGLHASERAIDALAYAPGPVICRVVLSGEILKGDDKLCASRREVLWMADATKALHLFACDVAEGALKGVVSPDPRSLAAISCKRRWVSGGATDGEMLAAQSAARLAAGLSAQSAAHSAAGLSAQSAAWSAARLAARSAAWLAARSSARPAARSAAYMAAWSTAGLAAWSAQNQMLEAAFFSLDPK